MTEPVPAPEQQGEPVCARCGHPAPEHGRLVEAGVARCWTCSKDDGPWPYHEWERHFAPPAPPSSEEAEAHKGEHYEARQQSERLGPLVEAARAYCDAKKKHRKGWIAFAEVDRVATRLLAAAAALDA